MSRPDTAFRGLSDRAAERSANALRVAHMGQVNAVMVLGALAIPHGTDAAATVIVGPA